MAARFAIALTTLLAAASAGRVDAARRSEAGTSAKSNSATSNSARTLPPRSASPDTAARRSTEPARTPARGAIEGPPDGRSAEESWSWTRDFHADPRGM